MPLSLTVGVVCLVALAVAARLQPMPDWRRHRVGLAAGVLVLAAVLPLLWPASAARSVVLGWLPGAFLLAGYWLPSQLPARAAPRLQAWLENTDRRLLSAGLHRLVARAPRLLLEYLEAAYLCCYLVVPAGLAWLDLSGHGEEANRFWTAVLVAALPCYVPLPWFETQPPRRLEASPAVDTRRLAIRRLNLAVLGRCSVGANTFPSGHAAASLAAALAVAAVTPAAGILIGVVSISIGIAAVVGRYHYALDVVFGAVLAVLGFLVSRLVG